MRGYGTRFVWNSVRSTLRAPSNLNELIIYLKNTKRTILLVSALSYNFKAWLGLAGMREQSFFLGPNRVEPRKCPNPVRKLQIVGDLGQKVTGSKLGASKDSSLWNLR